MPRATPAASSSGSASREVRVAKKESYGPAVRARGERVRDAVGDALLVGEVYLPSAKWQPYLDHLDAAFAVKPLRLADQCARLDAGLRSGLARRPA